MRLSAQAVKTSMNKAKILKKFEITIAII